MQNESLRTAKKRHESTPHPLRPSLNDLCVFWASPPAWAFVLVLGSRAPQH